MKHRLRRSNIEQDPEVTQFPLPFVFWFVCYHCLLELQFHVVAPDTLFE